LHVASEEGGGCIHLCIFVGVLLCELPGVGVLVGVCVIGRVVNGVVGGGVVSVGVGTGEAVDCIVVTGGVVVGGGLVVGGVPVTTLIGSVKGAFPLQAGPLHWKLKRICVAPAVDAVPLRVPSWYNNTPFGIGPVQKRLLYIVPVTVQLNVQLAATKPLNGNPTYSVVGVTMALGHWHATWCIINNTISKNVHIF